jgi:hypothetical protein
MNLLSLRLINDNFYYLIFIYFNAHLVQDFTFDKYANKRITLLPLLSS